MSGRTLTEAGRVAVAQRTRLEGLFRDLAKLDGQMAALEAELADQSKELSRLDDRMAELYHRTGLPRPGPDELAAVDVAEHLRAPASKSNTDPAPSGEWTASRRRDDGGNWESLVRHAERYITDHGIPVDADPLEQLLPPHRATEIRERFGADFDPAPWDHWDYGAVGVAVLAGALLDYFLVATPGKKFKGEPQRGSPLTAWMREQSERLAPMKGSDNIERNAFQRWVAELTTAAEKWAKVPYDLVIPSVGLTPNVHRLASLGHDPLLGLVFGVKDVMNGTCTFIDKHGNWDVIDHPHHRGTNNVLEAVVKVVVHGFSDVFTPMGLPPPGMGMFHLVSANSGFTLRKGGDPVSVRNLVRHMYSRGYDLRHFATASVSPGVAEVILWTYHGLRDMAARAETGEPSDPGMPDRLKRARMLALTHGLLASANIVKTALYSWNPTALNLPQYHILARRMVALAKLGAERDELVRRRLADGWEALLEDALRLK